MSKQPQPNPKTTKLPTETKTDLLMVMLAGHPGLADKLLEAMETGHFLITVSCKKKRKTDDTNDLQHFWQRTGYALNDVLPSIRHIMADFVAKDMPNAEAEGGGWH